MATGAWLLVTGYGFVYASLLYASQVHPGVPCLCTQRLAQFELPPNPAVPLLSYVLFAPIALVLAAWILRRERAMVLTERAGHLLHIASLLLVVGMGSVLVYLAVGVALNALAWTAPWPVEYPLVGLLLADPVVVFLAGIVDILGSVRIRPTVRSRVAHG